MIVIVNIITKMFAQCLRIVIVQFLVDDDYAVLKYSACVVSGDVDYVILETKTMKSMPTIIVQYYLKVSLILSANFIINQ